MNIEEEYYLVVVSKVKLFLVEQRRKAIKASKKQKEASAYISSQSQSQSRDGQSPRPPMLLLVFFTYTTKITTTSIYLVGSS